MTFPTHRTPEDPGPASPASDDTPATVRAVDPDRPPAGPAEQDGGPAGPATPPAQRPWETWEPGVRVMVRTRLPEGASHLYTDVLGTVTARSPATLTIETRAGTVEVPLASIATGKTVPPAPARRRPRDA